MGTQMVRVKTFPVKTELNWIELKVTWRSGGHRNKRKFDFFYRSLAGLSRRFLKLCYCNSDKMVYNYTRPRGPIAAMYSSPGPCYQLPNLVGYSNHDTRSTHVREPQWSFGMRHGKFTNDCSPGPCHLPADKIYNTGKDGAPHYSIYGRQKEGMIYANPGPGAYCPTASDVLVFPRQPAYSLSSRHKSFKTDDVPGRYNIY